MLQLPLILVALLPTIWIVDASNGPGTNFTDLPPAVAAAASGDTIVVRAGGYTPFHVSGKALTIRGAGASTTSVSNPSPPFSSWIDGVPAGVPFYVSGLTFFPPVTGLSGIAFAGLFISGVTTQVVLADVAVYGQSWPGGFNFPGTPGLHVSGGAEVHLGRSSVFGGHGGPVISGPGALLGNGSKLAADASSFVGGSANFGAGANGLEVGSGIATLSRCSVYGGSTLFVGSDAIKVGFGFVRVAGTSADVVQGGWLGSGSPGYAINALPGSSAIVHGSVSLVPASVGAPVTNGAVTTGAVALPYLSLTGTTTPAGELMASQPVTVMLDGSIPFAPFVCAVDVAPSFSTAYAPLLLGEVLLPLPPAITLQGTLDALGMLQGTVTPAATAPSLIGSPVYLQFGVLDAMAGQVRLSNGQIRIFQ